MPPTLQLLTGDARQLLPTLPADSVHTVVTSPPYFGLRSYLPAGHPDKAREIGGETSLPAYIENLVAVFREVRRVLRPDGTLWLNLGDSYARDAKKGQHRPGDSGKEAYVYDRGGGRASATLDLGAHGLPEKSLLGVPWRVALALQADGWILRSDIIWQKPNGKTESVKDRPTRSHEYVFLLTKEARYFYDSDAIREPAQDGTRNARSVWTVPTRRGGAGVHFATFPPDLVRPMILAGCPASGTVLDPFSGAGTTALVAQQLGRSAISMELSPAFTALASARLSL
jgi:site-specific DNA-methyltransferase (cytosine-N4-specific)